MAFIITCLTSCAATRTGSDIQLPESRTYDVEVGPDTLISPELLIEELDFLRQRIIDIHPQPFSRVTQSEFENSLLLAKNSLRYPLSRESFYSKVAPLVASLGDVHSFIHFPQELSAGSSELGQAYFPLAVIVHIDELYVAADLSQPATIPAGAKIISINNVPVDALLKRMRNVTAKETLSGQNRKIQLNFAQLLRAIDGIESDYRVQYSWQGRVSQVHLKGLSRSVFQVKTQSSGSYYGYSELTDSTALIWLNDFNEKPEKFALFLNEKFELMSQNNIGNLIIDVRYNQGGLSENLKKLISHITHHPVYWAKQGVVKVSEPLQSHYRRSTRKRREDKFHWGLQWLPMEWTDMLQYSIWWAEPGETIELELEPVQSMEKHIPNRVWVLTNGYCFSACSFFVASTNYYKLGKTIGEGAGSLAQYQFAYPVQVKLPHSGLLVNLPTMRLNFVENQTTRLIEPQEQVLRSVKDIIERNDPVLNRALREAENRVKAENNF